LDFNEKTHCITENKQKRQQAGALQTLARDTGDGVQSLAFRHKSYAKHTYERGSYGSSASGAALR